MAGQRVCSQVGGSLLAEWPASSGVSLLPSTFGRRPNACQGIVGQSASSRYITSTSHSPARSFPGSAQVAASIGSELTTHQPVSKEGNCGEKGWGALCCECPRCLDGSHRRGSWRAGCPRLRSEYFVSFLEAKAGDFVVVAIDCGTSTPCRDASSVKRLRNLLPRGVLHPSEDRVAPPGVAVRRRDDSGGGQDHLDSSGLSRGGVEWARRFSLFAVL
jgi:hypothetical protein